METISLGFLVKDGRDFLPLAYKNLAKIADEIIIAIEKNDSGIDQALEIATYDDRVKVLLVNESEKSVNFLIKNCTKDWIIIINAGDIFSDTYYLIRDYIDNYSNYDAFTIKKNKFVYHLGLLDAKESEEICIFKNKGIYFENFNSTTEDIVSPIRADTVWSIKDVEIFSLDGAKNLRDYMQIYYKNLTNNNKPLLDDLKNKIITGAYLTKPNQKELPLILKEYFKL
ncbi:MAG: hypothetical protein AABY22_02720 [Nanoarchaeota archaeon]